MPRPVRNDRTRVWLMQGTASPFTSPQYLGLAKAGNPKFNKGTSTPVFIPDPDRLGEFLIIEKIQPQKTFPQLPLTARYTQELSTLLNLVNLHCDNDIQVHIGYCQDPQDFNLGWDKIFCLENCTGDDYGMSGDLGALNESDRAIIDETVTFTGDALYEIAKIALASQASSLIQEQIVSITICDRIICQGVCGAGSDGCQKVFAVEKHGGTSPSSHANVIFSTDGGSTWNYDEIDSMGATSDPSDVFCVGTNLVVLSPTDNTLNYTDVASLIAGTETWLSQGTGFVATKTPNRGYSINSSTTWIVANGGYIYFTQDITTGVVVQDAGNATTQNLTAMHAYDDQNVVAVGASNAIVNTQDGGEVWSLVTGPVPGTALTSVFMKSELTWFVGTATGLLYATNNGGLTWTQVLIPGTYSSITDINFPTNMVGFLSANTSAPAGKILRTVNGGASWYIAPETAGNIPTNTGVNRLCTCGNANRVFGCGSVSGGSLGFIVKGA